MNTKQKILTEAVKLFAREGFDAVTVEMIADAVGIKAPSLYKHYRSKREIFESILSEMERRDAENAVESELPLEPMELEEEEYEHVDIREFLEYCRKMFRYWTEDEFASSFRKMLTVEQYKNPEMGALYHQYLGSGPLGYTRDIVGSDEAALALYGPMYMLYSVYDNTHEITGTGSEDTISIMLDDHLKNWYRIYGAEKK